MEMQEYVPMQKIFGFARVCGDAEAGGAVQISDHARVGSGARVQGSAQVYGTAHLSRREFTHERKPDEHRHIHTYRDARIHGDTHIQEDILIGGTSDISNNQQLAEHGTNGIPDNFLRYVKYVNEKVFGKLEFRQGLPRNVFELLILDASPRLIDELLSPAIAQFNVEKYIPEGWVEGRATVVRLDLVNTCLMDAPRDTDTRITWSEPRALLHNEVTRGPQKI